MSLPKDINFDRLVAALVSEMQAVATSWAQGSPTDEIALLNRITEALNRKHRKCDVGVNTPIEMTSELFTLHRQGDNQTDKYGADFAVTVDIPTSKFKKTALFQLKKSKKYKATLESSQLKDGVIEPQVGKRSFVLAVDEERLGWRVKSVSECLESFSDGTATKQFDTNTWDFLTEWLLKWLKCEVGLPSLQDDKVQVEKMLSLYKIITRSVGYDFNRENFPKDYVPARAWLYLSFEPKENITLWRM